MPWFETDVGEQRMQFIAAYQRGECSLSELCREFGISRKTGHKYLSRYKAEGLDGLRDKSRRPHHLANAMSDDVARRVLRVRARFPTWGPRKLKAYLERIEPGIVWPAASSIGELLQREGLAVPRRGRRPVVAPGLPLSPMDEPNQVWCADFKTVWNDLPHADRARVGALGGAARRERSRSCPNINKRSPTSVSMCTRRASPWRCCAPTGMRR